MKALTWISIFGLFLQLSTTAHAQTLSTGELGPMEEIKDLASYKASVKAARAYADLGSGLKACIPGEVGAMRIFLDVPTRATFLYPSANGVESLPEAGATYTLKEIKITKEMGKVFAQHGVSGKFQNRGVVLNMVSMLNGQVLNTAIFIVQSIDGTDTVVAISDPIHYTFFVGSTKACL